MSYAQLKELENIRERLEGGSNMDSSKESDIFKAVRSATNEIEDVLTQHGNSYSINDIIKYVKKQFYQVYLNNRVDLEDVLHTPAADTMTDKFKDIFVNDLDGVKGKLDFQNAMDDITKNYEWLKEKSFKALFGLEEKYSQIHTDLEELNKRIETYDIMELPNVKALKNSSLKENERVILDSVLEDIFGLIGYTSDSINIAMENSLADTDVLKEAIVEYHELLEDKIKKLPNMISSSNLKTKHKSKGELYELYVAEQDKSSERSNYDSNVENELKKDIKKLTSQVNHWKKGHKQLFDAIHDNQKLLTKMMKCKQLGGDSLKTIQELYSQSNVKIKGLIQSHYELHYSKSKKSKTKREQTMYPQSMSPPKATKSAANLAPKQNSDMKPNDDFVNRIDALKQELSKLKQEREDNESKFKDFDSLKTKHNLLKDGYTNAKARIDELESEIDTKNKQINELVRKNSTQVDDNYESLREFKTIINQSKKQCESKIIQAEQDLEFKIDQLSQVLNTKEKKIKLLESQINDFKANTLAQFQQESQRKMNQKLKEIQTLNSHNKDLKNTVDELTNNHEITENKLKRAQETMQDLKRKLMQAEDEQNNLKKISEEKESFTNSLYEERLKDKNNEIDELSKEINKKENEILQLKEDAIKLDTKLSTVENKVKGVQSLVQVFSDQLRSENGRTNQTIKLILEELESVIPKTEGNKSHQDERLVKMRELLKDKEKLEDQVNQLKWDIDSIISQNKKYEQESGRLQKEYDKILNEKKALSASKDTEIEQLENQLQERDQNIKHMKTDKEKIQKSFNDEKTAKDNIAALLEKYKVFVDKVCTHFKYDNSISHTGGSDDLHLLDGFFNHLNILKKQDEKVLQKAELEIKELRDSFHNRSDTETTTEHYNDIMGQLQAKEDEVKELNDKMNSMKAPIFEKECQN